MNFAEVQFPPDISYGAKGGPMYSTDIVSTYGGHEQRNINWNQARCKYNIASGVKTKEQWQELIAFFRNMRGRAIGFRYKDWSDYQGINQFIGKGDNRVKEFKLVKHYRFGNYGYDRIITKPVKNNFCRIYVDSVLANSDEVALNYTSGLITFATAPKVGAEITADFEFDVPVRFDTDYLDLSIDSYQLSSWQNITLLEIRTDN